MIGRIFKYLIWSPNETGITNEIKIPINWTFCDINHQEDKLFLWAMIDTHAAFNTYKFVIHGTGHKIDNAEELFFLKTVHMPNGLVLHAFIYTNIGVEFYK